jgi:hypothetical protein
VEEAVRVKTSVQCQDAFSNGALLKVYDQLTRAMS